MPLLDHFRPPLSSSHPWMGFHSTWATAMAQQLNGELLPEDYYAIPNVQLGGQVEIDVATLHRDDGGAGGGGAATATWAPPKPPMVVPVEFDALELFEVQVLREFGGPQLKAAVELVSPSNKDRPGQRRAFAIKCASYLERGVCVVIVDVVTERSADLHAQLMEILGLQAVNRPRRAASELYAVAYRIAPKADGGKQLEVWPYPLNLAADLPTVPLWIDIDLCLPLRLEESYTAACESLRIHV